MTTTDVRAAADLRALETPTTVEDAIRQDALLAAVEAVVGSRRKALKAWAGARLGRPGARVELEGEGVALVTDPQTKAVVVDDDAFRAWALTSMHDDVDTVERLVPHVLEDVLAGEHGDELEARLRDLLDDVPGALVLDVVVAAGLADRLAKPSVSRETDDGGLVLKGTGERVPGVVVRPASTAAPRLTPDKALVATLVDELTDRLAPVPTTEES